MPLITRIQTISLPVPYLNWPGVVPVEPALTYASIGKLKGNHVAEFYIVWLDVAALLIVFALMNLVTQSVAQQADQLQRNKLLLVPYPSSSPKRKKLWRN